MNARGIPIVGRDAASVMPGTDPMLALLAKERRMGGNLFKSDDGWKRFQERTDKGAHARRAVMTAKPRRPKGRRFVAPNGRTF